MTGGLRPDRTSWRFRTDGPSRNEGAGFDVREAEDEDRRGLFELAEIRCDVRDLGRPL